MVARQFRYKKKVYLLYDHAKDYFLYKTYLLNIITERRMDYFNSCVRSDRCFSVLLDNSLIIW